MASNIISALLWVQRGKAASRPTAYQINSDELERVQKLAAVELQDSKADLASAERAEAKVRKRVAKEQASLLKQKRELEEKTEKAEKELGGTGGAMVGLERMTVDEEQEKSSSSSDEGDWEDDEEASDVEMDGTDGQDPDDLSRYNLDQYDQEVSTSTAMGAFSNVEGLTFYRDNDEDPYITLKEDEEENREEEEQLMVSEHDNMVLTARCEGELAVLEAHLFNEKSQSLAMHHDLMLPAFPLCLEWLDFRPGSSLESNEGADGKSPFGNYVAVGTFDPTIEIWNLDVTEALYPDCLLGLPQSKIPQQQVLGTGKKKKKLLRRPEPSSLYHVDAVLSLSWNRLQRQYLASGSSDCTVKVWDLSQASEHKAVASFDKVHSDKVQAIQWHGKNPQALLTCAYDKTICSLDIRAPESALRASLSADPEVCRWDPWNEHCFYVTLENGLIHYFDTRKMSSESTKMDSGSVFTLSAHDGPVSGFDVSPHVRGCISTGSSDGTVKIWNVNEEGGKRDVSLVTSRDLGVGNIFTLSFSPDDPLLLAAGGSTGRLQLWDTTATLGIKAAFGERLAQNGIILADDHKRENGGMISVQDDGDDEDEDDE